MGRECTLKWLNKALQSLDDDAEYIAKDKPAVARQMVQGIVAAINQLPDNPAVGHSGRIHGTRERVVPGTVTSCPIDPAPACNA